jgi:hypothetical protein
MNHLGADRARKVKMRTWILYEHKKNRGIMAVSGPILAEDERVVAIDMNEILDMLERSTGGTDVAVFDGNEIISFLKKNGRL